MNTVKLPGSGAHFHQADYLIGRYAARTPAGTSLEDVMHPEYFQNHLKSLKPGTRIDVLSDDMALDCELRVESVSKTTARVRVLRAPYVADKAPKTPVVEASEVKVDWGGPQHKWRVKHGSEIVSKGFGTQEEAEEAAARFRTELA